MNDVVLAATLGAVVAVLGWLVNYQLSGRRDRLNQRLIARVRFTERQIEELYGPLAILLIEGRRTFEELKDSLGRDYIFEGDAELSSEDLTTWLFWVETDFFPRNERMRDLIMTKTHLIEGHTVPPSHIQFLDHHNSWKINHLRWKKDGTAYSWRSKINWPDDFEEEVVQTFYILKERHQNIVLQLAQPRHRTAKRQLG